jgi:uncharacterized protein (DUF697 family)
MSKAKLDTDTAADASATDEAPSNESLLRSLTAENEIKRYTIAAVSVSVVPVPLFDIAAVAAVQVRMIQKLSQLYGQTFSEHAVRNIITALAGGTVGYGLGATVAISMFKLVPGIGWMVGMMSLPVVSGATTYAIGRVFAKHFQEGGSIFDLSADTMRDYYKEQFQKGKDLAAKAKDKAAKFAGSEEKVAPAA